MHNQIVITGLDPVIFAENRMAGSSLAMTKKR